MGAIDQRLFYLPMNIGDLVEVTGASHPRKGAEGRIELIEGDTAWVIQLDTNNWTPLGEPFAVNIGLLTRNPSQLEILRGKIRGRANHHAKLPDGNPKRHGSPRKYQTRQLRKPPPG